MHIHTYIYTYIWWLFFTLFSRYLLLLNFYTCRRLLTLLFSCFLASCLRRSLNSRWWCGVNNASTTFSAFFTVIDFFCDFPFYVSTIIDFRIFEIPKFRIPEFWNSRHFDCNKNSINLIAKRRETPTKMQWTNKELENKFYYCVMWNILRKYLKRQINFIITQNKSGAEVLGSKATLTEPKMYKK